MLGSTNSPSDPLSRKLTRKPREKSVDFRISFPVGDDGASRRLARKIQESIARTLAREGELASRVAVKGDFATAVDTGVEARTEPARPVQRHTAPGCGAWWNF